MSRQFIGVEFAPGGRMYSYHNDGEPVAVDDDVVVMTPRGPQVVRCVSADCQPARHIITKAIVGKHDRVRPRPPAQPERLL